VYSKTYFFAVVNNLFRMLAARAGHWPVRRILGGMDVHRLTHGGNKIVRVR